MSSGSIMPGHVVLSLAGRDAGHAYVVVGWDKPETLLVADGRGRKVSNPKKKNVKHVKRLTSIANSVAEKLASGQQATDEDIRQALSQLEETG